MDLSWVVAVVAPRDVALHPNFRSGGASPPQLLAARLKGWPDHLEGAEASEFEWSSVEVRTFMRASASAFGSDDPDHSIDLLMVIAQESKDLALATVSGLFAAVALADQDRYQDIFVVLERLFDRLEGAEPGLSLLKALVEAQRALRYSETKRPGVDHARAALDFLKSTEWGGLGAIQLSRGVGWDSTRAWARVCREVEQSALSYIVSADPFGGDRAWAEYVRQENPPVQLEFGGSRNEGFESYVAEQFDLLAKDPTIRWTTQDAVEGPLLSHLMHLELIGSPAAAAARRTLGQVRILRRDSRQGYLDGLRLLRQSGDEKVFRKATRLLRSNGPFATVRDEARCVLMNRAPGWWRAVDCRALESGADLLSKAEAEKAARALLDVFAPRKAGMELEAWTDALGALGRRAALDAEIAQTVREYLCDESPNDPFLLNAVARLLNHLDWDGVPDREKALWRAWRQSAPDDVDHTSIRLAIASAVGVPDDEVPHDMTLEGIAEALNSMLRHSEGPLPAAWASEAAGYLTESLSAIRRNSTKGRYSFGGLDAAELAVIVSSYSDSMELWDVLASYVTDPAVPQDLKTAALERLTGLRARIPAEIRERLRAGFSGIQSSRPLHAQPGMPSTYTAGLRVGAVLEALDTPTMLYELAGLASSPAPVARVEAARTLDVVGSVRSPIEEWAYALMVPLCRDSDATVRAYAAHGLASANLSGCDPVLTASRDIVLSELLSEDGLIVPQSALGGILESWHRGVSVSEGVVKVIHRLKSESPSALIRHRASEVLSTVDV